MRLTTKGRYAVTAMLDLAYHSRAKPVTLTDIATRQTISLSYLEQLFSRLRRAGLVIGVRGPGGGYKLSREPESVSVADIILAVDEQVDLTNCQKQSNCHNGQPCMTHDLWMGLSETVSHYLEGISLGKLLTQADVKKINEQQGADVHQVVHFNSTSDTVGMALK